MAYKPVERKTFTLNEIAGNETVTDSRGREWAVRVYTLGGLSRFHAALAPLLIKPCTETWLRFLQATLRSAEPDARVRVRRALGLPDFSARRLARTLTMRDAVALRERIVRANLDVGFDEFAERCAEIVKKKSRGGPEADSPEKRNAKPCCRIATEPEAARRAAAETGAR